MEKIIVIRNGQGVLLRSPQRQDLDELLRYVNALSQEDTFLVLSGEVISREEELDYLDKIIHDSEIGNRFQIFAFVEKTLIANAEVRRVTKSRRRELHVGEIAISVTKEWRDQGIGQIILRTLIEEAPKMGLKILTLTAFANNTRAIELYKKLGFKIAGEIPKAIYYKGEFVGHIHMYRPVT